MYKKNRHKNEYKDVIPFIPSIKLKALNQPTIKIIERSINNGYKLNKSNWNIKSTAENICVTILLIGFKLIKSSKKLIKDINIKPKKKWISAIPFI